ncbi:MAG: globin domain-containing protein [Pseudonocardia sp.]|nr:globin domain-containing protein [Pseudonocardia sp.]
MTAEQLLAADPASTGEARTVESSTIAAIRASWALIEPHSAELARLFYATLFAQAPQIRDLFPATMEVQSSRLLRALAHVVRRYDEPEELVAFVEQLGRDHRKFGVLAEHYDAFGSALLSAIGALLGDAWTAEVETAWRAAYGRVATAMSTAAAADRGPASWLGHVVAHERIGRDLAVITVRTSAPLPYRAGQYVSVETPQRPRLWRYLSPANAPREDGTLTFHVRAVDGGWVSGAVVAHSRIGDEWRIGPPLGRMTVDPTSDREVLMVAGGTGVAPMKALVESLTGHEDPPRTQVYVGGCSWDDLYDFPALRRLTYDYAWLDVVPVVERDDTGSGAEIGTLAEVVTRHGPWTEHDVLVCGSPSMIRATVSGMLVAGTPLDRIRYDPFTVD